MDSVDKRTRVGILLSSLADMGGAVRVAVSIANRMQRDYAVTIFEVTDHDRLAFPLEHAVQVVPLRVQAERIRGRLGEMNKALFSALQAHPTDVMLGIGCDDTFVALRPCRRAHVPVIFCDHGALVNQLDDRTTTFARRACARFSAKTVALTHQTADDYQRIFHTPAAKVCCIPNWVPDELMKRPHTYDTASRKILWAGRLDREKGVDHLVDIAARVLPNHPTWTWDVYGEAVLKTNDFDVEQAIRERGLEGLLVLRGRVDDMYDRYDGYAIGTLTSYREGLPLFLLEGKACGLPLVSFDVDTGPRDIIEDGKDGFLIKPYDCAAFAAALEKLMDDDALRANMAAHARATAGAFSEDEVYASWCALIAEVLKR